MCPWVTWRSCQDAGSESGGLGWGLRICISNKHPPGMLMLLVLRPHFEKDVDGDHCANNNQTHSEKVRFQFLSPLALAVQSLSCVRLFATPWTAAHQASLSFTISQSLLKLMSTESVMPSNHFILCHPFSSGLQSFPASGSYPTSRFFASGGQNIGVSASASVFPMNSQDWILLGLIDWLDLLAVQRTLKSRL